MNRINVLELRCVTGSGGGPDKTILLSAAKADTARFHVVVAYLRNAQDSEYTISDRAKRLGIDFVDVLERFAFDPRIIIELAQIVIREKISLVHTHDYKTDVAGLILKALLGVKVVSTAHGWVTKSPKLDFFYLLDKLALRSSDRVMTVSLDIRDELIGWGLSPDVVTYLPNGVDIDQFARSEADNSLRRELSLDADQPLVGGIGRLSPEKDFPTFLRVAKCVKQHIPKVHFVIVGEGPERKNLEDIANDLSLDGTATILGQRQDIIAIYNALDLFLLTSLREGLPNVILEAMAMEVPVISTLVAGVGELIRDGKSGMLIRPGDVQGIANVTISLLRDREAARQLAAMAREIVCRDFSFADRVRKMERIYLDAMQI